MYVDYMICICICNAFFDNFFFKKIYFLLLLLLLFIFLRKMSPVFPFSEPKYPYAIPPLHPSFFLFP